MPVSILVLDQFLHTNVKVATISRAVTVRPWSAVVDKRIGPTNGGHHQSLKRLARCPPIHPGDEVRPVSYTHLDVYKRQEMFSYFPGIQRVMESRNSGC